MDMRFVRKSFLGIRYLGIIAGIVKPMYRHQSEIVMAMLLTSLLLMVSPPTGNILGKRLAFILPG